MERLLDVAADMFLNEGFSQVSINEIVRRAGGSLSTAYGLFGSKEGLLLAVWQHRFAQIGAEVYRSELFALPVEQALPRFVRALLDHALAPEALRMFRLVVAEGASFPRLREQVFPIVDRRLIQPLESYLRAEAARRRLRLTDPRHAALRIAHLVRGEAFWCLLRGLEHPVTPAERRRMVAEIVAIFWTVMVAAPSRGRGAGAPGAVR